MVLMAPALVIKTGSTAAESTISNYNGDIAARLTSRCDLVKSYLLDNVRINELDARQNRVRGWEYVLRRLGGMQSTYTKFGIDYSPLAKTLFGLRQQLEQFKVDFESYDSEFLKLNSIDCRKDPEGFWRQLETTRSFRAAIALSAEDYQQTLEQTLNAEEAKWQ